MLNVKVDKFCFGNGCDVCRLEDNITLLLPLFCFSLLPWVHSRLLRSLSSTMLGRHRYSWQQYVELSKLKIFNCSWFKPCFIWDLRKIKMFLKNYIILTLFKAACTFKYINKLHFEKEKFNFWKVTGCLRLRFVVHWECRSP